MPDYSRHWWYVEQPFPWLPIAACAIPILIIVFAIALGITLC